MSIQSREIKTFFFSQYFSDGLRISAGLLLPAVIFAQFDMLQTGLTISLGAACMSVLDTPGPVMHKRNAMLIGNALVFLVAMLTGFARFNLWCLGIEVTLLTFICSFLVVYGNRAAAIGTAGLLAMIFVMDKALKPQDILSYSLTVSSGGIWYMLWSLIFFGIRPYRAAQQALGENISDIVSYLRIKADFYLPETDIDENYKKLVLKQIQVSQHQDAVREMLFKSRLVVRESTNYSRMLVLTFVDLVDLFEQIMATHYDYNHMREQYADTGILEDIGKMLHRMGDELDNIGYAVLSNTSYHTSVRFLPQLEELKTRIDAIGSEGSSGSNMALKKVLINLRDLNQKIINIYRYHKTRTAKKLIKNPHQVEYNKFVEHQDYSPRVLLDNLTFESSTFRFALRVSLVCLVGFLITKSPMLLHFINTVSGRKISFGQHSYWVILTIIVIVKPAFSLSKQRNYQRLFGTIGGGLVGVAILTFIHNDTAQFLILAVLMVGAYSFMRTNYVVAVTLMTPYVLILFKFLGVGHLNIFEERIIDTIIGSAIALGANYFLFPSWESEQLKEVSHEMLTANTGYLLKIAETISGVPVSTTEYKLARKEVYIKSANLAAAFERMTSEPKSRQQKVKDLHKFVVLNHILSSYIATMASTVAGKDVHRTKADILKLMRRSITVLNESSKKLGGKIMDFTGEKNTAETPELKDLNADENLLKEQLGFVQKISADIAKTTDNLLLQ
ncbi:FUSC family membrane protein [Mucilaginibacter terrae]|uniref:Membrane protein YccC n=1 Tax=Mucilaginibacter terrae TaxID=1955052 RepID=A0ABU3GPN0_9SPHI|nr:FUSC family membrane protein [Mucilaginibacter terrae]MDT3401486.1 putative membrane protein YccC [Mucilaginibacter terrae]